ncbi:hypothetical protein ACVWYG_003264 [Pedobacter sp. UYEF25]
MSTLNIKLFLPLLFLAVFTKPTLVKHPLHVSTTEADYNTPAKTLEITCKLFTDDFEDALSKNTTTAIDLSKASVKPAMDKLVAAYLVKNLKFRIDGKLSVLHYIGFEKDREATNVYFELQNVSPFKKIEVYNSILYNLFTDQMSIIHLVKNGKRISNKVIYPDKMVTVTF